MRTAVESDTAARAPGRPARLEDGTESSHRDNSAARDRVGVTEPIVTRLGLSGVRTASSGRLDRRNRSDLESFIGAMKSVVTYSEACGIRAGQHQDH